MKVQNILHALADSLRKPYDPLVFADQRLRAVGTDEVNLTQINAEVVARTLTFNVTVATEQLGQI